MEKTYNRSFVQTLVNWAKSFVLSQDEDEITTIDDKNVAAILAQGQNDTEKLENSLKIVKKGKDKSKEFAQFEQVVQE